VTMQGSRTQASRTVVVGVLADPVAAPAEVAQQLEEDLPGLLSDQQTDGEWRVEVERERLPSGDVRDTAMMDLATERKRQRGWDFAVCITDLPLVSGRQPVVADASDSRDVAVVSLPAFGAMALRRRVRGVVAQLIADMRGDGTPDEGTEEHRRRRVGALSGAFRRTTPKQDGIDLRIVATRGRLRLLVGMVRDNRPWRLVSGLRGALVGAFAFSAFYLINTTVWQLAMTMSVWQRLAAVLGSITIMLTWLIVYHHLWERTRGRPPRERERMVLFNASTVLTLGIGLACGFVALFGINLIAALILFTSEVFGQYAGPEYGLADYLVVILVATAAATVAGAIGSGFESEESVREAAYSYRERERREAMRSSRAPETDRETSDSATQEA
jgi:hypothetical protein